MHKNWISARAEIHKCGDAMISYLCDNRIKPKITVDGDVFCSVGVLPTPNLELNPYCSGDLWSPWTA